MWTTPGVGCEHVSPLTDLDTHHSAPLSSIGHPLIHSRRNFQRIVHTLVTIIDTWAWRRASISLSPPSRSKRFRGTCGRTAPLAALDRSRCLEATSGGTHLLHRAGFAPLAVLAAENLTEAAVAELILDSGRAVIPSGQLLSESSGFSMVVKPSGVG